MRQIPPDMAGLFYSILSKSSCTAASEEKETLMAHLMKVKADNGTSLQRLGDRIWMDLVPAKHFYTERRSIHPHSPSFHPTEVGQIFEKGPLTCLQWSDQTLIQCGDSFLYKSDVRRAWIGRLCHPIEEGSKTKAKIHSRILQLEYLLHAMAHSTTSNSQAHYIHYIEYQFDAQKRLKGAKLIPYLFDAGPTLGFPVFAMMMKELSGAEKSALKLKDTFSVPDTHADTRLMEIFETFGMKKKAKKGFLSTLAAIMHLGKIVFSSHLHTGLVYVQDTFHLDAAAELLGLPSSHLLDLLSHVNESTKKGHSSRSLSAQETSSQCQALSKLLYERLFSWLIDQINMKLCLDDSKWDSYIAILDIPSLQSNQTQFSRNESLLKYALEKLKVSIQVVERPKLEWERDGLQGLNLPVTRDNSLLKAFENSGSDILHQMDRNEFQDSGLVDRFRTLVLGDLERAGSNFKFMRRLFDTYSEDNPLSLSRSQKRVSSSKYTSQFRADLEDLLETVFDQSSVTLVYHLDHWDSSGSFDESQLAQQLMTWKIATLASQATILYSHALKHYDFINAYGGGWISHLIHPSDAKQSCHNVIQCFRMTTHDVLVGNENIYFSHSIRFFMESLLVGKIKKLPSQAPTYASDEMSTTLDAESEFSEDDEPLIHQVAPKHHIVQHSYFKSPPPVKSTHKTTKNVSQSRKRWVCITYVCTFWAPSFILSSICRMRDKTRQMAWKEKVTLCMLILILNSLLLFLIIGVGQIVCPNSMSASPGEISTRVDVHSPRATVYMYGGYYEIPDIVKDHLYLGYPNSQEMYWSESVLGRDVGAMFPKDEDWATYCPSFPIKPDRFHLFPNGYQGLEDRLWYVHVNRTEELLSLMREKYYKGPVVLDMSFLEGKAEGDPDVRYAVAYDRVYDISGFYGAAYKLQDENFFGQDVKRMFDGVVGGAHLEMTDKFESLKKKSPTQWSKVMACLDGMFFAGYVDHRNDFQCQVTNYILMASSGVLVSVILIKFLAALQLHSARSPEQSDKFVMCLISCYTEGEESLRKTIQSLAGMDYDYRRKLLVLVADGMVTGHGNDRPTPSIILDILGVSEHLRDTKPFVYEAVGEGASQANYALVYSGLFDFEGRSTPYVLIVKVGRMDETILPGNRGKRDSQMIVMRYLSRILFNEPMNPLELEIYHQMRNIIGVDPAFYEFLLMVDADTMVQRDALNHLVSAMSRDSKTMAICGETQISNSRATWATMLQVYEYFISHHLSKAFESLFGTVLCLPGCFSMYRIKASNGKPVLIKKNILHDYGQCNVNTLHRKNLLHLGEDRFLTTTLIRHCPSMRTKFVPEAKCQTNVPESWSVLISQRRRWINSTVHNFFELLRIHGLCGVCCFSMRFVVLVDLFGTLLQPSGLIYMAYLVYCFVTEPSTVFPLVSICMVAGIFGLQLVLLILKGELQLFGWMVVHILAIPFFSFFLPIYSFLHFDDVSWGSTRLVAKGRDEEETDTILQEKLSHEKIPLKQVSSSTVSAKTASHST